MASFYMLPRFLSLLLLSLMAAPATAQSDAAEAAAGPNWQLFEEAVAAAEKSGKLVLLDVYAPWCGYCQRMQRETYTDADVLQNLDQYFEVARLDATDNAEQHTYKGRTLSSAALARSFGANGFPTTVFLQSDGEYIAGQPGFLDANTFTLIIRYVGTKAYLGQSFDEYVESL